MRFKNISLAVLLTVIVAFSACSTETAVKEEPIQVAPPKMETDSSGTSTWETYKSDEYGFTIKHPREFHVYEGTMLEGTSSEYYSISFSKGAEYGQLEISPNTTHGSRIVMEPKSYELVFGGKKTFSEVWRDDQGGGTVKLIFVEPIEKWKLCDESEFCQHITYTTFEKSDFEIFQKMVRTIEFE